MAATVLDYFEVASSPHLVKKLRVSSIEAGAKITASHNGPSGVAPSRVELGRIATEATSGCPVFLQWVGQDLDNDTIDIRLDTEPGGDLSGAVVEILVEFVAHASGGLTNVD